jgi:hypothetical protein
VRGRCPPYGEGVTYWPVVDVLERLDARPSDRGAAAAIRSLLGESDRGTSAEEIAWAFRKLLEEQAPLVVVFDDIQWGEDIFLDLVEGVALLTSGAAILLICMARPLAGRADERLREFGGGRFEVWFAEIAALAGDYEAAARYAQQAVDDFEEHGHVLFQAS